MKKNARVIGCQSSQDQQVMLLKSLLAIAGDRAESGNVWTYSDDARLDALVMDFDDKENISLASKITDKVVVALSRDLAVLKGQRFALAKPLRSKDLVHLLESLDSHFDGAEPAPDVAARSASVERDESLDRLLAMIRKKSGHVVQLDFGDVRAFLDIPAQKIYLGKSFSFTAAAASGKLACHEVGALPAEPLACASLADFFYEYTLSAERAYLLNGLNQNANFYIRQWPQFLKASNTKAIIKLSAYFSRRKAPINAAARDLVVGIRQIIAYVNAAHAQSLLLFEAAVPAPVSSAPASVVVANFRTASAPVADLSAAVHARAATEARGMGGLFGRIRQRLGI